MTRAVFFDAGHTLLYAHPDLGTIYAEANGHTFIQHFPHWWDTRRKAHV